MRNVSASCQDDMKWAFSVRSSKETFDLKGDIMSVRRKSKMSWAAVGLLFATAPALGALSGTATISSAPDGLNYDYTIVLTNPAASGSNIGTFWFAWTPPNPIEYDFLPSAATVTGQPLGWVGLASAGSPGNSIEYYNVSGSLIAPGHTGTFKFTSPDSPTTLHGIAFGLFPFTESFIYANATTTPGVAPVEAFAQVNPVFVVPEPSAIALLTAGCIGALCRRRRQPSG
jgi:hypothetical protein